MTSNLQRIVLAAAIIATVQVTNAAERVDEDRLAACANEPDEARRLVCYDEAVAASKRPTSAQPPAPATAPAVSSHDEFGISGSAVARQRSAEQEPRGDSGKVESITAVVTAVSAKPHGELVITLDNGQVWAQKQKGYFPAKAGDKAAINAGMLGSYTMVIGNRSTRVARVK